MDKFYLNLGVAEHEAVGCFFGDVPVAFGACVKSGVGLVPCVVGFEPWFKRAEGESQCRGPCSCGVVGECSPASGFLLSGCGRGRRVGGLVRGRAVPLRS